MDIEKELHQTVSKTLIRVKAILDLNITKPTEDKETEIQSIFDDVHNIDKLLPGHTAIIDWHIDISATQKKAQSIPWTYSEMENKGVVKSMDNFLTDFLSHEIDDEMGDAN